MPRFDASSAECLIFTKKEGLLSRIAHDLMLVATRFTLDLDIRALTLLFEADASSLRVRSALLGGALAPDMLSPADRQKIEHNIIADVLEAPRFPKIVFRTTEVKPADGGFAVAGELTLHGRMRTISCVTRTEPAGHVAEVTLRQPDFGITPFSALFGALRIQPEVTVRLTLPWIAGAHP
jgi:hypothetical protein